MSLRRNYGIELVAHGLSKHIGFHWRTRYAPRACVLAPKLSLEYECGCSEWVAGYSYVALISENMVDFCPSVVLENPQHPVIYMN